MNHPLIFMEQIHARAVEVCARYKRAEAELIEVLQQVEEKRVFVSRGHASLFSYVTRELGISENIAYSLITVARKAREVPELKNKLQSGAITLSGAKRVSSVLTQDNQGEWLAKASTLSMRQLEKEIVAVFPKEATRERASYVTPERIKLELGFFEADLLKLRRVQDLMSQKKSRAVKLEEVINELAAAYLEKQDPVKKAKRHVIRKGSVVAPVASAEIAAPAPVVSENKTESLETLVTKRIETKSLAPVSSQAHRAARASRITREPRKPIPAKILHQVNLRDQRRCRHVLPDGSRCNQSRWIEIHHRIPVSQGGENTLENLITLCSAHHVLWHQKPG